MGGRENYRIGAANLFLRRFFPLIFLALYGSFAALFCFVQPPFQIPDEPAHFLRAVQVSRLDLVPHFTEGTLSGGAVLPIALSEFVTRELDRAHQPDRSRTTRELFGRIQADARQQSPLSEQRWQELPNQSIYHPLYYLPQALAITFARTFTDRVYIWFYAARLFNCLSAVCLIAIALALSRDQQFVLAGIVILPMAISQISSASPDAWQLAAAIMVVAFSLLHSRPIEKPDGAASA